MTETMDEALERIHRSGPELNIGGPNHAPMAVDALIALGADDADVLAWVDGYRLKLTPMPDGTEPVTTDNWRESLGIVNRTGDWTTFFNHRLAEDTWQAVLGEWLPRLIPGMMAAGTHGLIRTAHAIRELDAGTTELKVEELGAALGYWAAYYQEVPGNPVLSGSLDIPAALVNLPKLNASYDATTALPREFVTMLDRLPTFEAGVAALAAPESIPAALTALTDAGSRMYLANAHRHPLVMLHSVTGPSAIRFLLPHLTPSLQRSAFAYIWQSVAAWASAFSVEYPQASAPTQTATQTEVVEACVETGDVHAIKFAEACVREHRVNPAGVYLDAAMDWARRLRESREWARDRRREAGIAIRA